MPGPDVDLEKPNAIGVLDRLTTNVALSLVAVVPTFLCCIVMPWRAAPLLERDEPDGRQGMLLAPGAYLPLSLLLALMAAAAVTTPEILNDSGAYLGPKLAAAIQSAIAEGDVWKAISLVLPVYGFAILMGTLGSLLSPWVNESWTLRTSLRAVFYVTATVTSFIILFSAGTDILRISTGQRELGALLYAVSPIPVIGLMFWMYLWFFRTLGAASWIRSGALSLAMIGLKVGFLGVVGILLGS